MRALAATRLLLAVPLTRKVPRALVALIFIDRETFFGRVALSEAFPEAMLTSVEPSQATPSTDAVSATVPLPFPRSSIPKRVPGLTETFLFKDFNTTLETVAEPPPGVVF